MKQACRRHWRPHCRCSGPPTSLPSLEAPGRLARSPTAHSHCWPAILVVGLHCLLCGKVLRLLLLPSPHSLYLLFAKLAKNTQTRRLAKTWPNEAESLFAANKVESVLNFSMTTQRQRQSARLPEETHTQTVRTVTSARTTCHIVFYNIIYRQCLFIENWPYKSHTLL